jgi:Leucine rich repeat variant
VQHDQVWYEVIDRFPDMRFWVAHNKTIPLEILERLRTDPDDKVQEMVRRKRSWRRAHADDALP